MDIKELMVGDLFRVNRDKLCIKKDTIVQVRRIDGDDKLEEYGLFGSAHCHPLDEKQFDGGIWLDYLDPIPLTPEILEKNGFEEFDGWRILDMDDVEIRWIGTTLEISGSHGNMELPNVQCIHELQHALRLCRIDKEIVL